MICMFIPFYIYISIPNTSPKSVEVEWLGVPGHLIFPYRYWGRPFAICPKKDHLITPEEKESMTDDDGRRTTTDDDDDG